MVALLACASAEDERSFGRTEPRHGPGELWINNTTEPESIDPGKLGDTAGAEIASNLFAGLLAVDPRDLSPLPDLAETYSIHDGGRRYHFHLRRTDWSDGAPLTAHDFEWSWKRALDPKTGSRSATLFAVLKNAAAFQAGDQPLAAVGVRALDDRTLEVELERVTPYFLYLLTSYPFYPVPRHVLQRLEVAGIDPDRWTRPEHIVSSGAYRLESWRFRRDLLLEANPRYWDAQNVKTPRVRVLMIESANTALNLYRTADIDWIGRNASLPLELLDHLSSFDDFRRSPLNSVYFYWLNTRRPPLDDPQLRAALSLAIDRRALVRYVARAGQVPTADLVPDGLAGYRGLSRPIFDPSAARALLRETAWAKAATRPPLVLSFNTSEGHRQIAEAIQAMWKQHLDLDVVLENLEWGTFVERLSKGEFQIARYGWNGDYPDPFTFLQLLSEKEPNNFGRFSSARVDELLARANTSTPASTRLELLRQAEALALAETPLIPLFVYTRSQLVKPYLQGFTLNYADRHPWKYLSVRGGAR